jgi:hypothetical protein
MKKGTFSVASVTLGMGFAALLAVMQIQVASARFRRKQSCREPADCVRPKTQQPGSAVPVVERARTGGAIRAQR